MKRQNSNVVKLVVTQRPRPNRIGVSIVVGKRGFECLSCGARLLEPRNGYEIICPECGVAMKRPHPDSVALKEYLKRDSGGA